MIQPGPAEIVLNDELDARVTALHASVSGLLEEASNLFPMKLDEAAGEGASLPHFEADYVLQEEGVSHFLAVRTDSRGLQAAKLAFSGADFPGSVPPIPEVIRQSQQALAGKLGSLTCVDFFSIPMGQIDASPVWLRGAETLAGGDRIEDLTRIAEHPHLKELSGRVQVARYAPAAVVLVEAAAYARSMAERYFVSRKLPDLVELAPEGSAIRHQLEVSAASLTERLIGSSK